MGKSKPTKGSKPKSVAEVQVAPKAPVGDKANWLHGSAPWDTLENESGAGPGLAGLLEDGQTEVLLGTIEDVAGGKLRLTHARLPGEAALQERDGLLSYRAKDGSLKPLQEGDGFATGGEEGGRVVFSADAFYYILLTDDQKYRAMQNSYRYYREDPIYRGLVNSLINFIIGKGLKFKAMDENPAVNDYLQRWWAANKMTGKDAEIVKRHLLTGEVCIRFYPKGKTGMDAKMPAVRLIPFWRLAEVQKDPEDAEVITGYRIWKAAGPYRPQVQDDEVQPDEVLFWKNSTPEEDRGEPPLLACLRPCSWYQTIMQNRVTMTRWRTAVVLFRKVINGTPGKVSQVSNADPAADTHSGLRGKAEKRMPKAGTVVTHSDKIEYDFKSPKLDASDVSEEMRKILLYIASAAQAPEFLFGDASNANYSSLFVAENPFIRQIEAYQTYFEGLFSELFRRVIQHGIDQGELPKMSTETKIQEAGFMARWGRRVLRKFGLTEAKLDDKGNLKAQKDVPTRTDVAIDWPSLLHKNQLEDAQTLQIHQSMGLVSRETLRGKCGYDQDVEEERLAEEGSQDLDQYAAQRQAELDAAGADGGDGDPNTPPAGARGGKGKAGKGGEGPGAQGQGKA